MEYTVQQLAKLSGVSKRTLHYYDEIDLLKPKVANIKLIFNNSIVSLLFK